MHAARHRLRHGALKQGQAVWQSVALRLGSQAVLGESPIDVDAQRRQVMAHVDLAPPAWGAIAARHVGVDGHELASMQVSDLVEKLGLTGKRLAIEKNGEIVPRSTFAETALQNGDKLEIVGAVGGG